MSNPSSLTQDHQHQLDAIMACCPELAALQAHVQAFAQLMTKRSGHRLEKWLNSASGQPELASFISGLRCDLDAVTAGLTLARNSGPSKATSTAKMFKRQMYGRASADLLRAASCSPTNDQGGTSRKLGQNPTPVS